MMLLCIGGAKDGRYIEVPGYLRIGDHFRIADDLASIADNLTYRKEVMETITVSEYVISAIYFKHDESILYLRPFNWSDHQAILHQFTKNTKPE